MPLINRRFAPFSLKNPDLQKREALDVSVENQLTLTKSASASDISLSFLQQLINGIVMLGSLMTLAYVMKELISNLLSGENTLDPLCYPSPTNESNVLVATRSTSTRAMLPPPLDLMFVWDITQQINHQILLNILSFGFAFATDTPVLALLGLLSNLKGADAASDNNTFFTVIGGTGIDAALGVIEASGNRYMSVGQSGGPGTVNTDIQYSIYAHNGTKISVMSIGGVGYDYSRSLCQKLNGEIVYTGVTNSAGTGGDLVQNVHNEDGSPKSKKAIGGAGLEHGTSIRAFADGRYALSAITTSFGAGGDDGLFIYFNSDDTIAWARSYGTTLNDRIWSFQNTQDGGYILCGETGSNILIIKITSTGAVSFSKQITGLGTSSCVAVKEINNNIYLMANANSNILVGKLNQTLDLSCATLLQASNAMSVVNFEITNDDLLLGVGSTNSFDAVGTDALMFQVDLNCGFAGARKLGTTQFDAFYSIYKKQNGGFVIAGKSNDDTLLATLDADGRIPHCNQSRIVSPNVSDVAHLITVSNITLTVTTPSLTIQNWIVTPITQPVQQTFYCPYINNTKTETFSQSHSVIHTNSHSEIHTHSLSHSKDQSSSHPSYSFSSTASVSNSVSRPFTASSSIESRSDSISMKPSTTQSLSRSAHQTLSNEEPHTRTRARTRTRPLRRDSSVLIQEYTLDLSGILLTQLSPSGSFVVIQTNTGFQFITINPDGKLETLGQFALLDTIKAITFSEDERYMFIANDMGDIQVIDLSHPETPINKGSVSTGWTIYSMAINGDGTQLLVSTNMGIKALSAKTPQSPITLTETMFFATLEPVQSIQTNPNTNLVVAGWGSTVSIFNIVENNMSKLDQINVTRPIKRISPVDQTDPNQVTLTLDNGETVFLNITIPSALTVASTLSSSSVSLTAVSGKTLLRANFKPGIEIFENTRMNWKLASEVGYSPVLGFVNSLFFSPYGKWALSQDPQGIKLIKIIPNPGRLDVPLPRLLNDIKLGFPVRVVLLKEEDNWIGIGGKQLTFISQDNPQQPKILGVLNVIGSIQTMVFFPDKTKILLVDEGGIACIDCYNASAPTLLGRWNTPNPIYDLTLSGPYAFMSQGEKGITILDITNPLNINQITTWSTPGSAQSIQFNRARSLACVADGTGVDIWQTQSPLPPKRMGRFNTSGFVSLVRLSADELSFFYASNQLLGQVNITNRQNPKQIHSLETKRPIKDMLLGYQGTVIYLADGVEGLLVVDTQTMQIKSQLLGTDTNAIALTEYEERAYLADMDGGVKIAELIQALSIIPLTTRTHFPVGVEMEERLYFFNRKLERITIERIVSMQYIDDYGQKRELPFWISVNMAMQTVQIKAPADRTDKPLVLALSVEIDGSREETILQSTVRSSLMIHTEKGVISVSTPSPRLKLNISLTNARFIPHYPSDLGIINKGNNIVISGSVDDVNHYVGSVLVVPDPTTRIPSDIALNLAQIIAIDDVNRFSSRATAPLRYFRFKQAPVINGTMDLTGLKTLDTLKITIPPTRFIDPDGFNLEFNVVPNWVHLQGNDMIINAPAWMQNASINILINVSNGYYWKTTTWRLSFDANHGPQVAKAPPSITRITGTESYYVFPNDVVIDRDNDTLSVMAFQQGSMILPGFIQLLDNLTFLLRPTISDVTNTIPIPFRKGLIYPITLRFSDKFNASTEVTFDINIELSKSDLISNVLTLLGIFMLGPPVLRWMYKRLPFICNTLSRKYWRNEIPEDLRDGRPYSPIHPFTGKKITKQDFDYMEMRLIHEEGCGHDKCFGHVYDYINSEALKQKQLLPSWAVFDQNAEHLNITLQATEEDKRENPFYLYRVWGKNGLILEACLIDTSKLSTYEPPAAVVAMPPAIQMVANPPPRSQRPVSLFNLMQNNNDSEIDEEELKEFLRPDFINLEGLDDLIVEHRTPSADPLIVVPDQDEGNMNLKYKLENDDDDSNELSDVTQPSSFTTSGHGFFATLPAQLHDSDAKRALERALSGL